MFSPENVPRLFDLIKMNDDNVKTAFYYALRDTLVAKDLDQASRIAYGNKRYRVVTLNGDLIETTGTMSGGGRTVLRGRMGQSVACTNIDPKEILLMENHIDKMEKSVREYRQKQTMLEDEINNLQPNLRQMKVDFEKFNMELNALEEQKPHLERQMNEQKAKSDATKADPKQVERLKDFMENKKKLYDEAAKTAETIQVKVDELTKEINDKSLGKLKIIDKNIQDINKKINQAKAEIVRLNVAVKTAERNFKKSTENIEQMELDIKNMETQLMAIKEQRTEIEEDASKLLVSINEMKHRLEEFEENYSEIKDAIKMINEKENKLQLEKIDIDQKMQSLNKTVSNSTAAIHNWKMKLSKLKLREIPDEEVETLKEYTVDELKEIDFNVIQKELDQSEHLIQTQKPNLNAIEVYL